jgi:hypothetical protein
VYLNALQVPLLKTENARPAIRNVTIARVKILVPNASPNSVSPMENVLRNAQSGKSKSMENVLLAQVKTVNLA